MRRFHSQVSPAGQEGSAPATSSAQGEAFSGVIWTILLGCMVFGCSEASLWATAQSEIQSYLPAKDNLITASAQNLVSAVAKAIISNTDSAITPADIAAAALEPEGGKVRSDRNTSGPLVAAAAISALISATDPNLAADVASVVDSVVDVNEPAPKEVLSAAGRAAVVKAALGALSDAAVSNPALVSADQALGAALAGDSYLQGLPGNDLTSMVQSAITGIDGGKGKAQAVAPQAAAQFVAGLVSGTTPNGAGLPVFAVTILKNVSKNTNVDELVAFQIAGKDNASQADLVALASVLFAYYPSAASKIAQGIIAATPATSLYSEADRVSYVQALTAVTVKNAASIEQGAIFVDPYLAGAFTQGVFNSIIASGGVTLARNNAVGLASGAGTVLGQDGDRLIQVAAVFSELTGSNVLLASKSGAYAAALINGAVKSTVAPFAGAASGGGGGNLNVGIGITATTVTDLASIVDLFADGIIKANGIAIPASVATDATEIGALIQAVANFTKNEAVVISVPGQLGSEPVAVFLAGTLANYIAGVVPQFAQAPLLSAVEKGVTAVTNATVDKQVQSLFSSGSYTDYPAIGDISTQETTVTNL